MTLSFTISAEEMKNWLPTGRDPSEFEREVVRLATTEPPPFFRAKSYETVTIGRESLRVANKDNGRTRNRYVKVRSITSTNMNRYMHLQFPEMLHTYDLQSMVTLWHWQQTRSKRLTTWMQH